MLGQPSAVQRLTLVLGPVVAEGEADSAAVLPRSRALRVQVILVLAGAEVLVGVAPPVVDDAVGDSLVVLLEQGVQRFGTAALSAVRPLDVVPEHAGRVAPYKVLDVVEGVGVVGSILRPQVSHLRMGGVRREAGHRPVEAAGVVDPEAEALCPDRVGDVGDQVPLGPSVHGVAGPGTRGLPEGDAVVVLGGGDHVLSPGGREQASPAGRVEVPGSPRVEEVVVGGATVDLGLVLLCWAAGDTDGVVVPLSYTHLTLPTKRI